MSEVSIAQVIGGAERVLRAEALGLAARGHAVRVLTRMRVDEQADMVDVGSVTETRFAVDRRNAVRFVLSSLRNAKQGWVSLTARQRPDVMVVHQSLPALPLRPDPSIPLIYVCLSLAHEEYESRNKWPSHAMGWAVHRISSHARRWTEATVIRRASRVVVLSEFQRRRVIDVHGIPEERIRLIPGGVDPDMFCPAADRRAIRSTMGIRGQEFVLFTVRNLVPRMGLGELIQAMARLRGEWPQLRLWIGGSGPLRAELDAQVKSLDLESCVRLLGFVPEARLPDYYRAADLFVLPTAELEGFGLVTVEALACGTPVFGTAAGATGEILGKLDSSLLAGGTDAASLAAGLDRLCRRFRDDPACRERLSSEGRALVLRDYTWARHCEQLEDVLVAALRTPKEAE